MCRGWREWLLFIFCAVSTVMGFIASLLFLIIWRNYAAGSWAFCAGVFAAVDLHLIHLHISGKLEIWHNVETLQGFSLLGILVSLAGGVGCIWYIFTAVYYHISVLPISTSAVITSVWTYMTFKFGILMFVLSKRYIREIRRANPPLLSMSS